MYSMRRLPMYRPFVTALYILRRVHLHRYQAPACRRSTSKRRYSWLLCPKQAKSAEYAQAHPLQCCPKEQRSANSRYSTQQRVPVRQRQISDYWPLGLGKQLQPPCLVLPNCISFLLDYAARSGRHAGVQPGFRRQRTRHRHISAKMSASPFRAKDTATQGDAYSTQSLRGSV